MNIAKHPTRKKSEFPISRVKYWLPAILFIILLLLAACQPKPEPVVEKAPPPTKLCVFALEDLRASGFEAVVLKEFARANNTTLDLRIFPDQRALLDSLNKAGSRGVVDLIIGLDNGFALSDSLLGPLLPAPEISLLEINRDIARDPQNRLIPYAFAHLAFIYNSKEYPQPPQSFGELQDARYYSQMAICDPAYNGLGRSALFWTLSLFGDSGYDKLWNSLRKNVRRIYGTRSEAQDALRSGECSLMLGFNSFPAWINEFFPSENHIKAIIPQEGSYQYVEYAALCGQGPNHGTAVKFLKYLITPEAQQFVMFKLGLLPANARTPLPRAFSAIPLSVYSLNQRLDKQAVKDNLPAWLDRWGQLFHLRLGI